MENENKQKQTSNAKSEGKNNSSEESVMKLIQPHDMSKTIESVMHVLQGNQEKLPDLLQDVGNIIVKASKRLTTTQLILAAGALTIGAVLIARYNMDDEYEYETE